MISMSSFHSMLVPILAGMILLAIGFNFRDKNLGVFSMWTGMLLILAPWSTRSWPSSRNKCGTRPRIEFGGLVHSVDPAFLRG